MTQIKGRLAELTRLANTPSGNPRWRLAIEGGAVYTTADDSACALNVSEYDAGQPVVIWLDRDGQVVFYDRPTESRCDTCGDLVSRCDGHEAPKPKCEMTDVRAPFVKVCGEEATMYVTYRSDHGKEQHGRAMCRHHLDWFLSHDLVRSGECDPVSLFPPTEATKQKG